MIAKSAARGPHVTLRITTRLGVEIECDVEGGTALGCVIFGISRVVSGTNALVCRGDSVDGAVLSIDTAQARD